MLLTRSSSHDTDQSDVNRSTSHAAASRGGGPPRSSRHRPAAGAPVHTPPAVQPRVRSSRGAARQRPGADRKPSISPSGHHSAAFARPGTPRSHKPCRAAAAEPGRPPSSAVNPRPPRRPSPHAVASSDRAQLSRAAGKSSCRHPVLIARRGRHRTVSVPGARFFVRHADVTFILRPRVRAIQEGTHALRGAKRLHAACGRRRDSSTSHRRVGDATAWPAGLLGAIRFEPRSARLT